MTVKFDVDLSKSRQSPQFDSLLSMSVIVNAQNIFHCQCQSMSLILTSHCHFFDIVVVMPTPASSGHFDDEKLE